MKKKEKIMLYITLLLMVMLIFKSLYLDGVKNLTGDALKFQQFAEKAADERMQKSFLKKKKIANYKIVSLKKISNKGQSKVMYYDKARKEYVQEEISGKYMAKIRVYLFHIVPYKEFRVKSTE